MNVVKLTTKLTDQERETHLYFDYIDKMWTMDSTIRAHFNKALKQKWKPITKYVYEDGTVAGYKLQAPERSITIRNIDKKQISEKQLAVLHKNIE